nr:CFF_HP1_G0000020.mRNA.1.CDS.1 [Saccharomyces cerevisiae]
MQGLSKDVRALCLLGWPESIVSEDGLGSTLAVERMLRNDEEYKEYLEDIEPYHGDPVGIFEIF